MTIGRPAYRRRAYAPHRHRRGTYAKPLRTAPLKATARSRHAASDRVAGAAAPASETPAVHRVEVRPAAGHDDPLGRSILNEIRELHLAPDCRAVQTASVYLIEADLDPEAIDRIAAELLADPVGQRYTVGVEQLAEPCPTIEVHHKPGVMDPAARSTESAIAEMLQLDPEADELSVRTGFRYDLPGATAAQARDLADRLLANPVVHDVAEAPVWPSRFVRPTPYTLDLVHVAIRELDDQGLARLSREGHLFLSLEEMRTIRDAYREAGREPTDIELETLAQTWSEHCVHKTLKSRIRYTEPREPTPVTDKPEQRAGSTAVLAPGAADFADRPGHTLNSDGSLTIDNLLRSTIAAATDQLRAQFRAEGEDWCLSVFVDNAGIIAFDQTDAVSFKVETHNHPSAIEPYGGAATGIGGCIRDTIGTGLAAKPIANTDVFCVAFADHWRLSEEGTADASPARSPDGTDEGGVSTAPRSGSIAPALALPKGVLHPRRILKQVVAGVRDYGNRMGIPTVNGAVTFDDRYLGNPLVFCGSVGLIPNDKAFGEARPGDRIIALGGRTGRDGIHGATFSSAELTDTHAEEFSHAVQIGNPITEKKMLDVILQARDHADGPLFNAITDCGAGGFSSAVGEMGEDLGASVELANAPLKYAGLTHTEIWISEAQERMVLAVPPDRLATLTALCDAEDVEYCDLGHFGTEDRQLLLHFQGEPVGQLSMRFLHDGLPQPTREARWDGPGRGFPREHAAAARPRSPGVAETLCALLAHPDLASKHWIIRQYDHEVQGGSTVKPLVGPFHDGPADAAVLRPKLDSPRAIAVSNGLATPLGDVDPYWMTLAAIDEAVRNAVCVGADPTRIAVLDNFCWPSCEDPSNLGSLVRAAEACYDGALAYRTPFISGKDSLNNQFTTDTGETIAIPPTLLISAVGIVPDAGRSRTSDAKAAGNLLLQVGSTTPHLGASYRDAIAGAPPTDDIPRVDLRRGPRIAATVAALIADGLVASAHDCSEGGMLVAAAEMAFAGRLGLAIDLAGVPRDGTLSDDAACFAETPSRYLLEVAPEDFDALARRLRDADVPFGEIGAFNDTDRFTVQSPDAGPIADLSLQQLLDAWRSPLDW